MRDSNIRQLQTILETFADTTFSISQRSIHTNNSTPQGVTPARVESTTHNVEALLPGCRVDMAVVGLGVVYLRVALAKLLGVGTMVVMGTETPDLVAELVLRAVGAGMRKGVGRPRSTPRPCPQVCFCAPSLAQTALTSYLICCNGKINN